MTIIVSILTPQGIVFVSDSRQVTVSPSGYTRVGSDTTEKIFQIGSYLGATINGQGTFYLNRVESPQSITEIIHVVSSHLPKNSSVRNAALFLHQKINVILAKHLSVTKNNGGEVSFYVGGYNPNSNVGEVYRCDIPGKVTLERKTNDAGMLWSGERDIINRLVKGYDPRMMEFLRPLMQKAESAEMFRQQLLGLNLYINFQTMTLQDAVDLAVLLVRTTMELWRLSDGLVGAPGHFPTCGGAIEVAVVTKKDGFQWLQHKELEVRLR